MVLRNSAHSKTKFHFPSVMALKFIWNIFGHYLIVLHISMTSFKLPIL